MLTTLSTLKARLSISEADTTNDALLTSAIKAVSARFDKETNRTLARTVDFSQEFPADDTELSAACYQQFADQDLLESVKAVLRSHQRWSL